jgi:hypothetical protein
MFWNIDKTLRDLFPTGRSVATLRCELINVHRLTQEGLCPRPGDTGMVRVWILSFGQDQGAQKTFYGFTIHDVCLRTVKFLKKAKARQLLVLGVRKPKKRNNFVRKPFRKRKPKEASV